MGKRGRKIEREIPAEIVTEYAEGRLTVLDVMRRTGFSYATVYGRLTRAGLIRHRYPGGPLHIPADVLDAYRRGELRSVRDVAAALKVSPRRVRYVMKRHGILVRSSAELAAMRKGDSQVLAEAVAEDYRRGDKVHVIAARYGIGLQWVRDLIRRAIPPEERRPRHRPKNGGTAALPLG